MYSEVEVWDFSVMTREQTMLIIYLLYGVFSAILKKNTTKNTGSNFQHPLARARGHPRSKKYLYASIFLLVIEKIAIYCGYFCCFRSRACSFYSQFKRAVEPSKIFIMPGHYKN